MIILFLVTVMAAITLPTYAEGYQSISNLLNECSSEHGGTNCANNNADTFGDENIINPQISQSSQAKNGPDQPVLGANLVFGRTDFVIPPNEASGATANCPPDTVAISGAYHGSGAPGIYVYGNKFTGGDPDNGIPPTGWFIGAFNTGSESQAFTVWSICAPIID